MIKRVCVMDGFPMTKREQGMGERAKGVCSSVSGGGGGGVGGYWGFWGENG